MKKQTLIAILILSLSLGFGAAAGIARMNCRDTDASRQVAFWSLLYEYPNPEKLPVKVNFRFL